MAIVYLFRQEDPKTCLVLNEQLSSVENHCFIYIYIYVYINGSTGLQYLVEYFLDGVVLNRVVHFMMESEDF